jgi:hypothetical protein
MGYNAPKFRLILTPEQMLFQIDEMIPMITEGLRAVQKVEDFVDAAIGEECHFECSAKGRVPVPRPGHVPSSNGKISMFFLKWLPGVGSEKKTSMVSACIRAYVHNPAFVSFFSHSEATAP